MLAPGSSGNGHLCMTIGLSVQVLNHFHETAGRNVGRAFAQPTFNPLVRSNGLLTSTTLKSCFWHKDLLMEKSITRPYLCIGTSITIMSALSSAKISHSPSSSRAAASRAESFSWAIETLPETTNTYRPCSLFFRA